MVAGPATGRNTWASGTGSPARQREGPREQEAWRISGPLPRAEAPPVPPSPGEAGGETEAPPGAIPEERVVRPHFVGGPAGKTEL